MTDRDDYAELERLLPFHVNGTLDADTRARSDAALADSQALRSALAEERALQLRFNTAIERELRGFNLAGMPGGIAALTQDPGVKGPDQVFSAGLIRLPKQ